jgi:hypothetical protein
MYLNAKESVSSLHPAYRLHALHTSVFWTPHIRTPIRGQDGRSIKLRRPFPAMHLLRAR